MNAIKESTRLVDKTILITGGSEGVGFALAKILCEQNTVIICARNEVKLNRAKKMCPKLIIYCCDITDTVQRKKMLNHVINEHPSFDCLINNAGAKHVTQLLDPINLVESMHQDMLLNFTAPVMLCSEILDYFKKRPHAMIINITTGLVYLPKAQQAFYSAAKAALHSYTQSLQWECALLKVDVIEVLLPLINTQFHKGSLPDNISPMSASQAAKQIVYRVKKGNKTIHIGKSILAKWLSIIAPLTGMKIINK
ncbi:SDR family NAD(P)-dependent oxidoreductase [Marinicellulosiphila megalodicopiae]|uniref:SDR family NAD(P)-dependent oxidoreductase n=1 Tax=Marinicellulosiphila megalodicopiae TaxID=2724896 RepID=UPI003BB0B3C9